MIASRDYRLTNEIMNLYKQIIWEAFILLQWYILPTTIYKNVFVFISVNHVKENDDVICKKSKCILTNETAVWDIHSDKS
jgi:hypothetical protein